MKMRGIRYWGRIWAETVGITVALGVILYVFTGMDMGFRGDGNLFGSVISLMAWYLIISSAFVTFIVIVSCFQQYIPLTMSFGSTRRSAVMGTLLPGPGSSAVSLAVAALLWAAAGDDIARSGLHLLGAVGGGLLAADGIAVLFGIIILRCRRITFVLMFMGLLIGAAGGLTWYLTTSGKLPVRIADLAGLLAGTGQPLLGAGLVAAGAVVYLLAFGLAFVLTRKAEVRI